MQVTSSMRPETRGIFHFNALPATRSLYLRLPDIQRVRRRYWSLQKSCAEFAGSRQLALHREVFRGEAKETTGTSSCAPATATVNGQLNWKWIDDRQRKSYPAFR